MNKIELMESIMEDISKLTLTGPGNWNLANTALNKLGALIKGTREEQETRERNEKAALEQARIQRECIKQIAESNGEDIIGGETLRINEDGTQEVLIP